MRETPILHAVRAALMQTGRVTVVRNNTGVDTDRGVRYGLGKGGPDLIGALHGSARAVAFEVKSLTGRVAEDQKRWRAAFIKIGGFYAVVRSADQALAALERAEAGLSE